MNGETDGKKKEESDKTIAPVSQVLHPKYTTSFDFFVLFFVCLIIMIISSFYLDFLKPVNGRD